jgi:RNA polymerase sigma-70 factor (ECF subfamily)
LIGILVTDTRRITSAIASGDPEAFAVFYKAKFAYVYRIARDLTKSDEDVSLDVVQDTMVRVIRYARPFDDAKRFDRWLARVTKSVAYDYLRRERRRRGRERQAAERKAVERTNQGAESADLVDWVRGELATLDHLTAQIVDWRFRAGLTLEAIGQRLGLGTGAVHGRLTRALARLRRRTSEMKHE